MEAKRRLCAHLDRLADNSSKRSFVNCLFVAQRAAMVERLLQAFRNSIPPMSRRGSASICSPMG
jgi:hypothetical protein